MKTRNKITILAPLAANEIGGTQNYVQELTKVFSEYGYSVSIIYFTYYKKYPTGIRHIAYFLSILFRGWNSKAFLALDSFSVAFPAKCVSIITKVPMLVRIGGDFLYEEYLERTREEVPLKFFYEKHKYKFTLKEQCIKYVQAWVCQGSHVIWNSIFLKTIWHKAYTLQPKKEFIIENPHQGIVEDINNESNPTIFLASARPLFVKNINRVVRAWESLGSKTNGYILKTGMMTPQEYQNALRSARVVIVASYTDIAPNTILQARALGLPCILTKENGLNEAIQKECLLVDPLSEQSIADALALLLEEGSYQKYKQKNTKENITMSWEDYGKQYCNIIASL